ncbi:MAG: FtsX-like permease family protein, partial [Planctomycetota bacterium]
MIEAAIVAVLGASVGAILGVEYARVMVYGLNNWWVAATSAPFIELHASSRSLLVGWGVGVAAALASLAWTLRQLTRLPVKQLLSGDYQPSAAAAKARARSTRWIPATCLLGAAALAAIAWGWEGEAQAGAFFGGGALALIGLLALARMKIGEPDSSPPQSYSLVGLATRNARRNPSRTILALALAATASFLIVALSAFRLSPTDKGVGRFDVVATSDLPLLFDLNTPGGRSELGFDEAGEQQLAATVVVSFRMQEGEDASCLNLYQTTQPTILGAPSELAEQSDFAWASVDAPLLAATTDANAATLPTSPWQLLDADLGVDGEGRPVTPMILDRSTAFYSLKLYRLGDRLTVRDEQGNAATLQLVGLLANSVLQGTAIVGEPHFERLFPNTPGRRFFMIRDDANSSNTSQLAADLESRLEDFGFDAVDSRQRLAEFLAVQNTYLSTFQSLGGLGMLLGVVGLAVVQLRSVLERRRELALLRAAGFRKQRLVQLVCMENLVILLGGLAMGSAAALAAVLPHAAAQGASTPWATLAALLAVVALVGAFAGWIAVRGALAAPLIPALRGD